jgi:hypothetical protein
VKDYFRQFSTQLLFKPFYRSGLSANKITVLNFLTLEVATVVSFATGFNFMGLLFALLAAMVDFIDGAIAKARTGYTKLGQYLDTSLDWLYLIGAISWRNNIMYIGYLALIAITWGNWVEFNGNVKCKIPFLLGISPLIITGVFIGHLEWSIIAIAVVQWIRAIKLYRRSVWEYFKD